MGPISDAFVIDVPLVALRAAPDLGAVVIHSAAIFKYGQLCQSKA